jgi:pimeloyl-ACP methyl ester carboxylesterase
VAEKIKVGDVVVLLPGILGRVLQVDGHDVWAPSKGALLRGIISLGRNVKNLELQPDDDVDKDDLGDGVTAPRLMPDIHLVPRFWKIDGYSKIREVLTNRFDLTPGSNWFDFPYDWRRDNRVAARQLAEQAPAWLEAWKAKSGNKDAKLVLLGHSMGGLVARAFLELYDGWKITRSLITFGTPYRGAVNALDFLANGVKKGVGPFKLDLTRLLGSMTSVYQLCPVFPCVDLGDGTLVHAHTTDGLPDGIVRERLVAAREQFHDAIAKSVEANGPARYAIHPVVGIFQPTLSSATLIGRDFESVGATGEDGGDGTVPRVSATPIELADQPVGTFVTDKHGSLQNVDSVLTQVAGVLTFKPSLHARDLFSGFELDLPDVVSPGDEVRFSAATMGSSNEVTADVIDADSDRPVQSATVKADSEGRFVGALPPLAPGVYRFTLRDVSVANLDPITDLFVVADDSTESDPDRPARDYE